MSAARPGASDATFPQVAGAAILVGGLIALVDRYDRKAAAILAVTLLLSVMVTRDIVAKSTELIDAITGVSTTGPTGQPGSRPGPRGER